MREHANHQDHEAPEPARTAATGAAALAGALARASGELDPRRAATALQAGNRAVGQVLARRERRYQDAVQADHNPTTDAAGVERALEALRTTGRRSGRNVIRLGTITGVASAPASEQLRVNYLIWQYMQFGRVENAELDAIIEPPVPLDIDSADPLGTTPPAPRIQWTLRFTTANGVTNVEADRIGVADDALGIAAVRGFPGVGAGHAAIRTWVQSRYPSLASVAVPVVAPVRAGTAPPTEAAVATANAQATQQYVTALDAARRVQARTPAWFTANYGIDVLDAAAGSTRMRTAHSWPDDRRAGMRDWEPDRLQTLEHGFETIDTAFLTALRGIKLVRQRVRLVPGRRGFTEAPQTYGETVHDGSEVTIVLYDSHGSQDHVRFVGGRSRGTRRAGVMQVLHELGHAVSYKTSGLETAFGRRFGRTSPTAYGRSAVTEEFPEAFALYHADPDHLHDEWNDVYTWMDEASRTGTAPAPPAGP